ncbi:MAG TPA: hypothetical protein VG275_09755 [Solirubrobacteraceae bacterium]|nr:hypothetical protein [Solirubrobacteraceae bacterium]
MPFTERIVTVLLWTVTVIFLIPAFALAVKAARWIFEAGAWQATLTGMWLMKGAVQRGVYRVPHRAGLAAAAMLALAITTAAAPILVYKTLRI